MQTSEQQALRANIFGEHAAPVASCGGCVLLCACGCNGTKNCLSFPSGETPG